MSEEKRLKKVIESGNPSLINEFFDELYNRYKGLVCFVIAKYVKNSDDVVDIAQDVFLAFFNNVDKVTSNIKYYLITISKNMALNFIKKTSKLEYISDDELNKIIDSNYKKDDIDDEFTYNLLLLKKHLKQQEYDILCMHLFDNYTFKSISIKLNIKETSIKTLYYRAVKKSRIILERNKKNEK